MNKQDAWMHRHARPVDLARWKYWQGTGSASAVLEALGWYQNGDGGFGHGLEPDYWNPNSSPIQAWRATLILREIGCFDGALPLVGKLIGYLERAGDNGVWKALIPSNDDHPHAPWWQYSHENDTWGYNPGAALSGFLVRCGCGVDSVIQKTIDTFLAQTDSDMHELPCFLQLYDDLRATGWKQEQLGAVRARLAEVLEQNVVRDPTLWGGYCLRPSMIFNESNREFQAPFRQAISEEQQYLMDTVGPDGAWDINWAWAEYPEAFAVAKEWWKGDQIIKYCRFLAL